MKTCAIVPARGGSSYHNKNLLQLGGISLIERAALVALEVFDSGDIYFSSDSEEYLSVVGSLEIKLHRRPAWASSGSATAQNVLDSMSFLESYDALVYLQPTSPFRTSRHINECLDLFDKAPRNGVLSVTKVKQYPSKMLKLEGNGYLTPLQRRGKVFSNRSPTDFGLYYPNGAIYILPKNEEGKFEFDSVTFAPYMMTQLESIDIDSFEDYEIAKVINNDKLH